jgi:dihydroxy-acid dehydratase
MGHEGMRSSLASRDAIADTVELTMRGHCYDALWASRAATSRCPA